MAGRPIIARSVVAIAAAAAVFLLGAPAAAASGLPPLAHLTPGAFLDAHQDVPLTVVFVGLEPGANPTGIDAARLLAPQLAHTTVRDRTTRFYEQNGADDLEPSKIGLTYDYSTGRSSRARPSRTRSSTTSSRSPSAPSRAGRSTSRRTRPTRSRRSTSRSTS